MPKLVLALGGNALGKTSQEQKIAVKKVASVVADLHEQGNKIIICHGNGPQVGMINKVFKDASKISNSVEMMPLAECGAMSQGYIGFHIQNAIQNEILKRKLNVNVVSLVSQTLVNIKDKAFSNPTKPVGDFMTKIEAQKQAKLNNWIIKEDAGRGYRRVVPSPKPIEIIESKTISILLENNTIVIAGGGGGIPVYKSYNKLLPIDAVIDKDFTSAKLAEQVKADDFIILTAVDKIILNYGKPNQKPIIEISTSDLEVLINKKEFAEGSMMPKVKAVTQFTNSTGKNSFIADLKYAKNVLNRKRGTKIFKA